MRCGSAQPPGAPECSKAGVHGAGCAKLPLQESLCRPCWSLLSWHGLTGTEKTDSGHEISVEGAGSLKLRDLQVWHWEKGAHALLPAQQWHGTSACHTPPGMAATRFWWPSPMLHQAGAIRVLGQPLRAMSKKKTLERHGIAAQGQRTWVVPYQREALLASYRPYQMSQPRQAQRPFSIWGKVIPHT